MSGGIAFSEKIAWMVGSSPVHAVLQDLIAKCNPDSVLYRKAEHALETMLLFIDISELSEKDFNEFADHVFGCYQTLSSTRPAWIDRIKELLEIIKSDPRFVSPQ